MEKLMIEHLELGAIVPVLLADGVEDTPWVVGTLTLNKRGVRVDLPYVTHLDQFKTVSEWIDGKSPPKNLFVTTNDLEMSLFGLKYGGDSRNFGRGTVQGFINVEEALMKHRDGNLHDPLLVEEVQSEIDGLIEWSGLSSVVTSHNSIGEGRERRNTIHYTVSSVDGLTWRQGEATLSISSSWNGKGRHGIDVEDRCVLTTKFDEPRPFVDHLVEQRKFIALLSLLFGTAIAFRNHQIRDSRFTDKALNSTVDGCPYVELISRQTIREYATEIPSTADLRSPMIRMSDLTSETLTKWGESYDSLARFLLPVVGLLRVRNIFVENMVINAAMSLEAFGKLVVHRVDGEEGTYKPRKKGEGAQPTMATYIFRGIKPLRLSWEGINGSEVGLAKAIAKNYNAIKHPDKDEFPDSFHTQVLGQCATNIVRLNALRHVASEEEYAKVNAATLIKDPMKLFELNNLFIDDNGTIVTRTPASETIESATI
jgi:hypothetical protein